MNWIDLLILLTLAWFVIAGVTAGLLRELVTLAAVLSGVVLAGWFHTALAEDILIMVNTERVSRVSAFAAIFLAVLGAGQIAAALLKGVAMTLALGPLDRLGGVLLGALKGLIIVEATLFLFARYRFDEIVTAMDASLLTPIFLRGIPFVLALLPEEFREAVDRFPAALGA